MVTGEQPKRLAPQPDVTRRLYLLSGNRCAYPGCTQAIMDSGATLVGEICHIRAAMPDGARFDNSMTNEQRRAFGNLVLMCANHHTIIDKDSTNWTVGRLNELKTSHESIYASAVDQLRAQVGDVTEGTEWRLPTNLGRTRNPPDLNAEELAQTIKDVDDFARRLARIPFGARSLLALMVIRGSVMSSYSSWDQEIRIPVVVLDSVANCSPDELERYIGVLRHAEFLLIDQDFFDDAETWTYFVGNSTPGVGWKLFCDIKMVARGDAAIIRQVLEDLDFTALDAED